MFQKFFLSLTIFLLALAPFTTQTYAQITIDGGDTEVEIEYFGVEDFYFTNLVGYGVMPLIGYIGIMINVALVGFVVANVLKGAIRLQNEGKSGIEEASKIFTSTMKLAVIIVVVLGSVTLFGMFWVGGSVFNWPAKLSQCGGDGLFLFRAEYDAYAEVPEFLSMDPMIYCCRNFEGFLVDGEHTGQTNIGRNYKNIMVGSRQGGGWLFIEDPGAGVTFANPLDDVCREFDGSTR